MTERFKFSVREIKGEYRACPLTETEGTEKYRGWASSPSELSNIQKYLDWLTKKGNPFTTEDFEGTFGAISIPQKVLYVERIFGDDDRFELTYVKGNRRSTHTHDYPVSAINSIIDAVSEGYALERGKPQEQKPVDQAEVKKRAGHAHL